LPVGYRSRFLLISLLIAPSVCNWGFDGSVKGNDT
jgi:hypothetical protein